MSERTLVAGIDNIFLGDDGFGVEVARRLALQTLPVHVRVADFGIRGLHLAYELLDGDYRVTILVDAVPRGESPGTVYMIEPALDRAHEPGEAVLANAHGIGPDAVFDLLRSLSGDPGKVLLVGCEPACTDEGMGLSDAVEQAIPEAIRLIRDIVDREAT
jgi:hydrogenase maturation protease